MDDFDRDSDADWGVDSEWWQQVQYDQRPRCPKCNDPLVIYEHESALICETCSISYDREPEREWWKI
jgi:hypothetical protein